MEIPVLSRKLTNEVIDLQYPCVKIAGTSDAVALMLDVLPEGDLPIVSEVEGDLYQVALMRKSALDLDALRKVTPMEWYFDVDHCAEIRTTLDILEVLE